MVRIVDRGYHPRQAPLTVKINLERFTPKLRRCSSRLMRSYAFATCTQYLTRLYVPSHFSQTSRLLRIMPQETFSSERPPTRRGSSLKGFLATIIPRSSNSSLRTEPPSQSSLTNSTPPLPTLPSVYNHYSPFVQPRKNRPYLLVTRRGRTKIPSTDTPIPRIRIGHAALPGAFTSRLSAVPTELCSVVLDYNFDKYPEEKRKALKQDLERLLSRLDAQVVDPVVSRPDTSPEAEATLQESEATLREKHVVPHLKSYQSALSTLFNKLKVPSDLPDDSEWREYGSAQIAMMPDSESVAVLKGHNILDRNACGR